MDKMAGERGAGECSEVSSDKFLDWKRWDLSVADAEVLRRGGWLTADHFNFAFGLLCGHPEGLLEHPCFAFVNPLTVMMLRYGDTGTVASVVEVSKNAWGIGTALP